MGLLLDVLLEHWEAADLAAERAWLEVWRKFDARARGSGPIPGRAEIADAFLLRCEADELLQALRRELREERERMHVPHEQDDGPGVVSLRSTAWYTSRPPG